MMASELSKRILTGLVGGSLFVSALVYGGVPAARIIALLMSLGMMWEFSSFTFSSSDKRLKQWAMMASVGAIAMLEIFSTESAIFSVFLAVFLSLSLFFLFTARGKSDSELTVHAQEWMYAIFGLAYLGLLPTFLPLLRGLDRGQHWVLLFFFMVWACDTGAYFSGKRFGRHKLFERVSPKKTWEGALGGLLASLLVSAVYYLTVFGDVSIFAMFKITLMVNVMSQLGDLCESLLKRGFAVKDSGSILPGHGGLLDRFDSIVFSLPVMYAGILNL